MRAILMFYDCERQIRKTASTDRNFEEKGEPRQIQTKVPLLTSLTPYCKSARPNRLTTIVSYAVINGVSCNIGCCQA